jgi:putative ABC transport system ATP-binding protein
MTREHSPIDAAVRSGVEVRSVSRTFGAGATRVEALRSASLSARPGELLAIKGRSGSGKTTLLNLIGGLDRPDSGVVEVGGVDVTALSEEQRLELRRRTVSYVFQSFGLIPILTARENIGIPLRLRHLDPQEREQVVTEALAHVGLERHGNQRPGELSGGQQQRVALARSLASRPRVLLADEPTGQLDSETGREIMDLIARLTREETMTTIVTTHDPVLLSIADRVLEIEDGVIDPG